jgi:hypothetical protein
MIGISSKLSKVSAMLTSDIWIFGFVTDMVKKYLSSLKRGTLYTKEKDQIPVNKGKVWWCSEVTGTALVSVSGWQAEDDNSLASRKPVLWSFKRSTSRVTRSVQPSIMAVKYVQCNTNIRRSHWKRVRSVTCLFCRIVKGKQPLTGTTRLIDNFTGEIPSFKLIETDHSFVDRFPHLMWSQSSLRLM